jgi:hypothetical protein
VVHVFPTHHTSLTLTPPLPLLQLTVKSNITTYLFDQFKQLDLQTAGLLGSVYGLLNIIMRALGGVFSDLTAKSFGMRGRLWWYWLVQTLGGENAYLLPCAASFSAKRYLSCDNNNTNDVTYVESHGRGFEGFHL